MITSHNYQLPVAQQLTADYIAGKQEVISSLYGYHSGVEADWTKRASYLDQATDKRAKASHITEVLSLFMSRLELSKEQKQNLKHLEEGALVVIGGQQAGLWTGPLLVIHKAISVIQAAKSASEQLNRPIVPVFWIAGEDHDWDEVNHTYVISTDQQLKKLSLAKPAEQRTSVSKLFISNEQWNEALDELMEQLPGSEFKEQLSAQLREIAERSETLTHFFAEMMHTLFAEHGLLLIDSDFEALRKLEQPMFKKILEQNDALEEAYYRAAKKVEELGYNKQADVHAGCCNLFVFAESLGGDRTLLYKDNGQYRDRKGQVSWSGEQLFDMLEQTPQSFSNNVLTRPIMQDYVFPVLATILGPGEISYWALTGEAFNTVQMQMPIIVPRMSYTLVEGIIAKNMEKYELSFADVMEQFQERKAAWLQDQDELQIKQQYEQVKEQFIAMYQPLIELAGTIQAGLVKLGETNMSKIVEQISYMENKTIDAQEKQYDAAIRQMDRIELALKPSNKPQERVLCMISYWNRYNRAWLDAIFEAPYSRTGGHELVLL